MPRATKTPPASELTLEERRARRQLRREKQREDNLHRAAKMHAARLKMEATSLQATTEPKAALFVGCSGWRYWHWRDSFYAEAPQPDWFKHYLKRFDTVEINGSFYSWPTVANVRAWRRGAGRKKFVYTVKVCELITHLKKLKGTRTLIKDFGMIADVLGDQMGCFDALRARLDGPSAHLDARPRGEGRHAWRLAFHIWRAGLPRRPRGPSSDICRPAILTACRGGMRRWAWRASTPHSGPSPAMGSLRSVACCVRLESNARRI